MTERGEVHQHSRPVATKWRCGHWCARKGAPATATASRTAARWRPPGVAVCFVAAAAVGGAVRLWQTLGRGQLVWADSEDFLASAREGWLRTDLWAGPRTPAVPALLKLVAGESGDYVALQSTIAVLCWAALAASVWTVVEGRWTRVGAAAAVVALSVTTPVVMWDRSVLSETLGVALLALVAAAGIQLARGLTPLRVAATLGALAAWLATRDSHAIVALVGGLAAAVVLAVWLVRPPGGAPRPRRPSDLTRSQRSLAALALGALVLGGLASAGASHGDRYVYPMRNVMEVRVLPYPERVRWFAAHGMPQADEFLGPDRRAPVVAPGQAPVTYVGDDDPKMRRWLGWVAGDARMTYARWLATHPVYAVGEPFRQPERTFNNALGDRSFYAPTDLPRVPLVDLLAPPTIVVLMVAAVAAGWAFGQRRVSPLLIAGSVLALLAVPHGLAAWHSDGMETARHLVVPAMQLRLGVVVMVAGLLAPAARPGGDEPREPARLRSGHA
jgi:hypothetical protein